MKAIKVVAAAALVAGLYGIPAYAADAAAGQATFNKTCKGCHAKKMDVFAGKSAADLETTIKGIEGGTVKHPKKLTLSADDVSNVAAYLSSLK
ncbi:MAG TPA: c-type cytochrome [Steroidobacteraceae bacterium]|jgi:mono/diheme cytochrome c family protein